MKQLLIQYLIKILTALINDPKTKEALILFVETIVKSTDNKYDDKLLEFVNKL